MHAAHLARVHLQLHQVYLLASAGQDCRAALPNDAELVRELAPVQLQTSHAKVRHRLANAPASFCEAVHEFLHADGERRPGKTWTDDDLQVLTSSERPQIASRVYACAASIRRQVGQESDPGQKNGQEEATVPVAVV